MIPTTETIFFQILLQLYHSSAAIPLTHLSKPIGATLIRDDFTVTYYVLDLYRFDEQGALLASSNDISRQETINFIARRAGVYYIRIVNFEGSGRYTLDASWR